MGFYADLHIHSKYSRATSRNADLEHMALWARKKGVTVIGTGDFTHPAWFREIEEKLVPAEPGLYRLRPDLERQVDEWLGDACRDESSPGASGPTRFMLEVEISTIYKKDDATRKVHHLIYAPDLEKVARINTRLERIGNIASDGRPILGLDSRDLLQIALDGGEGCYLIPAHIWTPWFAVLGSKSGFDTIEHCYGDLASEIFAVETGLSSDPAMNRLLSDLDRYTLVSNSDAHSPPKIGREACVFETELDYFAMRRALETKNGYGGTVEFFAEEGKYHLDGHRKCGVCLLPEETRAHDGRCPECGKPVTLGVLHRVMELADRFEVVDPDADQPYRSRVPLDEILSEIEGVGPKSKAVARSYEKLVTRLGSELFILDDAPLEEIERAGSSLVAEALSRMRDGQVIRRPGFDGEYGVIRLFEDGELERRTAGAMLFDFFEGPQEDPKPRDPQSQPPKSRNPKSRNPKSRNQRPSSSTSEGKTRKCRPARLRTAPQATGAETDAALAAVRGGTLCGLDPDQASAAATTQGPLVIIAGPGTGKTRTVTHRIAHLVTDLDVAPESCVAITFTRRAAAEMTDRLEQLLPEVASRVAVMTFHAFGLSILNEFGTRLCRTPPLEPPLRIASEPERLEVLRNALDVTQRQAYRLLASISRSRRGGEIDADGGELREAKTKYEAALGAAGAVDFDDLLALSVRLLEENGDLLNVLRNRYRWITVDEYQDIDSVQYRLLNLLVPADGNVCVIGDPDQAIYGFRGADVRFFERFTADFPTARSVRLKHNYRSTRTIVRASHQMVAPVSASDGEELIADAVGSERVEIHECASDRAEAELVVRSIERLIGGSTFFSFDSGRVDSSSDDGDGEALAFGDFSVLFRTEAQAGVLTEAFHRSGIPFQRRSHRPLSELPGVGAILSALDEVAAQSSSNGAQSTRSVPKLLAEALRRAADPESDPESDPEAAHTVEETAAALRALAERFTEDLAGFRAAIALGVDVDFWDPRAEAVSLLTLHASKGLEFPVVFIVGCEEGVLPLYWGAETPAAAELAEERRLFFVGMTRAERCLVLTHARRRAWRGPVKEMLRSSFLDDIERRLLRMEEHRTGSKPKPAVKQLTLFD